MRETSFATPAQVMLGLVTDIKNNKRRPGKGADAAPAVLPAPVQSWLKASGVGEVELRNVTWTKLLGSDKRVKSLVFPFAEKTLLTLAKAKFQHLPIIHQGIIQSSKILIGNQVS